MSDMGLRSWLANVRTIFVPGIGYTLFPDECSLCPEDASDRDGEASVSEMDNGAFSCGDVCPRISLKAHQESDSPVLQR